MIALGEKSATLKLPKSVYGRDSLEAAALAAGEGVEARLSARGRFFVVELSARGGKAELERAVGVFSDEALCHAARQRLIKEGAALSGAALSRAIERGLAAMPPDPLEQLEPQVAQDRREELARLLREAGE